MISALAFCLIAVALTARERHKRRSHFHRHFIIVTDEVHDLASQVVDRMKDAARDDLALDFRN